MATPDKKAERGGRAPVEVATIEDYVQTFEGFGPGRKVLEDLMARFHDRPVYVRGGVEAQRETDARAAQQAVIGFVLRRLGQIHDRENPDAA